MRSSAPPLRLVTEPEAADIARRAVYIGNALPEAEVLARTEGRVGGGPAPTWTVSGSAPFADAPVQVLQEALVWPAFGLVGDAAGRIFRATAGEVLSTGRTLADFAHDTPAEQIGPAAVFMPFGGAFNYGHFLLDALTSLQALEDAGLLAGRVAVTDSLPPWRRELLALAFPDLPRHETRARLIAAESAAWADSMDHYLHRAGEPALRLRERILAQVPTGGGGRRRIYLSRRGGRVRVLLNERALERALAQRGFTVVQPERLSVAVQVALFRDAEVIVGASGAALANALFAGPDARIVEILPTNFAAAWVRNLCLLVGCGWSGWFAPSPMGLLRLPLSRGRGERFLWRLDLPAFLPWLDEQLAT